MCNKFLAVVVSLLLLGFTTHSQAVCNPADQIASNPAGNAVTNASSTACNAADPYQNFGTIRNDATLVNQANFYNGVFPSSASLLNNNGTLINQGSFFNYGTLDNAGTLVNESGFYINYRRWNNNGTLVNNGSFFNDQGLSNAGTIHNAGDFQSFGPLTNSGTLVNDGTLTNAFGAINKGTVYNNGTWNTRFGLFENTGQIYNAGQMVLTDGTTNSGQFSILARGEVTGLGVATAIYTQTGGTTRIDGLMTQAAVNINDGVLQGKGTITAPVTIGGGIIAPGHDSPGLLTIIGDYTQAMAGSFAAQIGSLQQGDEYDLLRVSGRASLAGILDVSLYDFGGGIFSPHIGDSFDILSAEHIIGSFNTLLFAPLDSSLQWKVSYLTDAFGTTDVVRLQVAAVPEPEIYAMLVVGMVVTGWTVRRRKRKQAAVV